MQPGALLEKLPIGPLRRILPSQYAGLQACRLRGVWRATKTPVLLPSSPKGHLGMVIHKILEMAGKGTLARLSQVEEVWNDLVRAEEKTMVESWLEHWLVPLQDSVPPFNLLKAFTMRKVEDITAIRTCSLQAAVNQAGAEQEVWVQTQDGLAGGFIDCIEPSSTGTIIRDYKSGSIYDSHAPEDAGPIVKEDYRLQLKLYAALYEAARGEWPCRLELLPLEGKPVEVPFQPEECRELLSDALCLLKDVNGMIMAGAGPGDLASPSPSVCRYCEYRPACCSYRLEKEHSGDGEWPADTWGVIKELRPLFGGAKRLLILSTTVDGGTYRIRSLSANSGRHPALDMSHAGDTVAAFNLRPEGEEKAFSETPLTVIYRTDGACGG